MKYALIHWTNSNSSSIVPCSSVIDQGLLQDSTKIGKIFATILGKKEPSSGWKKHDGMVICTHDNLAFLKKKEEEFLTEDSTSEPDEPVAVGRGHRQPKPITFPGDESEPESVSSDETLKTRPTKAKKLVKLSQQTSAESIIQRLKRQHASPVSQQDSCQSCIRLNHEVKRLKLENEALCKGLPGVVKDLNKYLQTLRSGGHQPQIARPNVSSPSPSPSPHSRSFSSSPTSDMSEVDSAPRQGPAEYELGSGVFLPQPVLNRCNKSDFKRLTRDLMCALFSQEEMSMCSVFGRKGVGAARELRQPLNGDKIKAIIEYVRMTFPSVETSQITQTMAYKLKDVRTARAKTM